MTTVSHPSDLRAETATSAPSRDSGTSSPGFLVWAAYLCLALTLWAGQLKQLPPFSLSPVDATALLLGLSLLSGGALLLRRGRLPQAGQISILLLIVFMAILGSLSVPQGPYSQEKVELLLFLTMPLAIAAALIVTDRADSKRFMGVFIAVAAYVSLTALLFGDLDASGRVISAGGGSISFARAAGSVLVFCAAFLLTQGHLNKKTVLVIGLAALSLAAIISIGSRGPIVGLALGTFAAALMQFRRFRIIMTSRLVFFSVAMVALGAAVWVRSPKFSRERILGIVTGEVDGRDGGGRSDFFAWTWENLPATPLGNGWGSWSRRSGLADYPHNIFLEIWFEAGWMGLLAFLLALALAFWYAYALFPSDSASATLLVGLITFWIAVSLLSGDVNDNRTLFALLVAVAVPSRHSWQSDETDPLTEPRAPAHSGASG